jgi:hypothetical protein
MKNPNNVPSGQQIIVKLPDNLAQAQAPQQAQQASAQAGK